MDLRRAGGSPADAPLVGKSPPYRYSSYLEYQAGPYKLSVNKTGSTEPLKIMDAEPGGELLLHGLGCADPAGAFRPTHQRHEQSQGSRTQF